MGSTEQNNVFIKLCNVVSASDCGLILCAVAVYTEVRPISHVHQTDCELTGQIFSVRVRLLGVWLGPDCRLISKTNDTTYLNWVSLQPVVLC